MKFKLLTMIFLSQVCVHDGIQASNGNESKALKAVTAHIILPKALQLKTIDGVYPIIKNDEDIELLAQKIDDSNVNEVFSPAVVSAFQAGEDVSGLTVLQLAVLLDRLEMVEYLLKLPKIEVNKITKRRTALDYCDFYNIAPILDLKAAIRPKIQKKLLEAGAAHGSDMQEYLKERTLFGMRLKTLEV